MQDQRGPTPEEEFARRCRLARGVLGMSQTELARRLADHDVKVDGSGITRLEKGERNIRLDEAMAIAKVLGFPSLDAMLRPAEPPEAQLERARAEARDAAWRAMWASADWDAARSRLYRLEHEAGGNPVPSPSPSWMDLPDHWKERPWT